ncbi:MAG: glycosyltransferase family 39 protein [Victivallales bacterium]|jgi:4-amino-4-deoxy-L-arabinose transferase-like glycosyltransferase
MKISFSGIFKNKTLLYFLLILLLAFGLRLARSVIDDKMDKDSVVYLWMAKSAAAGDINSAVAYNVRMPPLYIFLMAAGEYLGIGAFNAGMAVSVMAGTLLLIPVFSIAKTLSSDKIALFASIVAATHPYLVRISAEIMRDSLFLLLIFAGLAFALKAAKGGKVLDWCIPGVFAGFAVMTRAEGIDLVFAIMLWFVLELYISFSNKNAINTIKKTLASTFCLLAAFLLVTLPVQLLLSETSSTWGPVDYRIMSFVRGFTELTAKEVLKLEKH